MPQQLQTASGVLGDWYVTALAESMWRGMLRSLAVFSVVVPSGLSKSMGRACGALQATEQAVVYVLTPP